MPGELNELQIRQTAILLGLSPDYIRKDYFVTKAIRILTNVESFYFDLVFQGGTSLSKGYGVISRLSEDIDFRIMTKSGYQNLSKNAKRQELRTFRHALIDELSKSGFKVPEQGVKVFYEGRYTSIKAVFESSPGITYLKPHIAIDCFLGGLELKPEKKNISSMIKVTLGDTECDHQYFPVSCVNINETAAEKWIALSRRIVDAQSTPRDSDKHLVRHLYDLYQLQQSNHLCDDYFVAIERVIEKEQALYDSDEKSLYSKMKLVFNHLQEDKKWENHWQAFLEQMVYQKEKPKFEQAISVVRQMGPLSLNKTQMEPGYKDLLLKQAHASLSLSPASKQIPNTTIKKKPPKR